MAKGKKHEIALLMEAGVMDYQEKISLIRSLGIGIYENLPDEYCESVIHFLDNRFPAVFFGRHAHHLPEAVGEGKQRRVAQFPGDFTNA